MLVNGNILGLGFAEVIASRNSLDLDIGTCGHHRDVMVSKIQWKPFWLATLLRLYPQNDWTGWQDDVNDDVFAQDSYWHVME